MICGLGDQRTHVLRRVSNDGTSSDGATLANGTGPSEPEPGDALPRCLQGSCPLTQGSAVATLYVYCR